MSGGLFFRPRPLTTLTLHELRDYALLCDTQIGRAEAEIQFTKGQLSVLTDGIRRDAFWTFGGFGLAVASIATTPFFTAAGFGALAGGATSLEGVRGYLDKARLRAQLRWQLRDCQASVDFCRSEVARIADELDYRGIR